MSSRLGEVRRTLAVLGSEGGVRTCSQQEFDHLNITMSGSGVERRVATRLPGVGVCTCGEQLPGDASVATDHGAVQGMNPRRVVGRLGDLGPCREQPLDRGLPTEERGEVQGREAIGCHLPDLCVTVL